jgi:hypothetical protein
MRQRAQAVSRMPRLRLALLRELSVGLIRGDFFMYPASVDMLAKSSGSSFKAVLSMPTDQLDMPYVACPCCLVCLFPPCLASPAETESRLPRQGGHLH